MKLSTRLSLLNNPFVYPDTGTILPVNGSFSRLLTHTEHGRLSALFATKSSSARSWKYEAVERGKWQRMRTSVRDAFRRGPGASVQPPDRPLSQARHEPQRKVRLAAEQRR